MTSKKPHRPAPKQLRMQRCYLIFCEGETEETYVHLLQRLYHAHIRIITQVEGQSITPNLVRQRKEALRLKANEPIETFLMYDMDVAEVNKKLFNCDATPLLSNPSVELWFLLHSKQQRSALSTEDAIRELKKSDPAWRNYEKGDFTPTQKILLWENRLEAVKKAKELSQYQNPSSQIFILIDKLEKLHDCPESSPEPMPV